VAQETGLHIHLIAHCRKPQSGEDKPPSKYDLRGSAAISDQCPNVITVWANKAKQAKLESDPHDTVAQAEPDALIGVEKQRNGEFEGRLKLWFHRDSFRFCDDRTSAVEPYSLIGAKQ
jgi:twinkle protein